MKFLQAACTLYCNILSVPWVEIKARDVLRVTVTRVVLPHDGGICHCVDL